MADKILGGASTRPLLVAAALTVVVLLFFISGATRSLPLDSLIRSSSSSFSPPERDPKNCSAAAAAAAATGDPPQRPDKLLGGLLRPDFDEASCVSRYQSSQFWHSNHTPSSYLLRKLRSYEALHKKCGPNSELFNRSLPRLNASTGGEGGNSECNYVVWLQAGGLGNRLIALVSAFLYALLNDKVLLLSVPGDLHDTLCEPFPDTSWTLPSNFPISNFETHDFYGQSARSYGNLLKNKVIRINSTERALLPPFLYLHLTHDAGDSDKMFYCEDAQSLFQNFTWIFLRSNQYFAPALFLMPQYDEELSKLFPEKETVFHHLGRYLLHPTNSVWGYVTRYYEAYLANARDRLGIQVRIFPNAPVKFELMLAQIIDCTLKEGILPNTLIDAPANSSTAMGTKPKSVLVTSLQTGYFETIRNMYYERATATGEVVAVYQPSHEETQRTERQGHNAKALAEMYLLSFSDTLVTSAFSTFGYVAQGLGGLRPWIVLRPDNRNSPACRRASSMEPCFHFAPGYDCKAGRNVDKGNVVPHVKHCEDLDFHWGLNSSIKIEEDRINAVSNYS